MTDGYEQTLHGLLRKRAELSISVERMRQDLGLALASLDHLEATIRLFNPDIAPEDMPERPVPPPNSAFRGEVGRFLLHTLRTRGGWVTTHELARAIMDNRGLSQADRVLAKLIERRTGHSLASLRRQGHVTSERVGPDSALLRWRVAG